MFSTYAQIRAAVSPDVFERNTIKAILYLIRDTILCVSLALTAIYLDNLLSKQYALHDITQAAVALRCAVWAT